MDTRDSHEPRVPARLSPRPTAPPAPPSAIEAGPGARAAQQVSLRVVLRGLTRYWWQILIVWGVTSTALVGLVYTQIKPVYEAVALMKAEPGAQELFGITVHPSEAAGAYLETQVQLITSANVLTAVASDEQVAKTDKVRKARDVTAELRRSLQVGVLPGTYLIRVAMRSPSPGEAALIVNKVVDAFLRAQALWSDDVTRTQIQKVEDYKKELEAKLREQDDKWRQLAAANGAVARGLPPAREKSEATTKDATEVIPADGYRLIQQQLMNNKLELIQAEAMLARREAEPKAASAAAIDPRVLIARQVKDRLDADPELKQLADEYQRARGSLDAARRLTANLGDPSIVRTRQRFEAAYARWLQSHQTKERELRETISAQQVNDPDRELREAQNRVRNLRLTQEAFERELSRVKTTQNHDATAAVEIQLIRETRDGLRQMLEAVSRRLEQLKFESQGDARISQIDKAIIPGAPISDGRLKMVAVIPIALLGGLLGLAMVAELRSGRVSHPDELAPLMPVDVFSIPPLPRQRLERRGQSQAELVEIFAQRLDHLRVALGIEVGGADGGRCVMITSASGGEGKTTLSAQLAGRCASAGIRTLLIDADLRRATLSRMLDVPQSRGLVEVLAGKVEAEEAVVGIDGAGSLFLLPSGTSGLDPSRVLRGPDLGQMLERLRQDFELILIDTPPVLPVPDALTIGQWVDGALIAVRSDTSRFAFVGRASRLLASGRVPVLGVVINGVRPESGYADYAYRYTQPAGATSETSPSDPRPEAGTQR